MTKEIKIKATSGKTHTLQITYNKLNSGRHTCFMHIVETGKSVNAGGNNQAEAHNAALAKLRK